MVLDVSKWHLSPAQILVAGFLGVILVGTFLLMLPAASTSGQGLGFVDALFTATSAVCVTGLVVVDTGTHFTLFGQLVIIALIQVGGLGFMTMATLIYVIIGRRIGLRERLVMQEALNQLTVAGVVRLTLYVIKTTMVVEFIGGTILAIRWYFDYGLKGIYFGYWHAVSAFCNAGFDLFGGFRSLTAYVNDWLVNLVIASLIITGGIGFTVLADIHQNRQFARLSLHSKLVLATTAFLLVCGTAVILLLEYDNPATMGILPWSSKLLASFFQSVTPRTAGYNTIDIGSLRPATLFFLTILMFIGASPGSTGGGIKTTTAGVLFVAARSILRGREETEVFTRRLDQRIVYKAFAVTFFAAVLVVIVTMVLSITEPQPFLNILFEVTSAFGTVGLSTGITPTLTVYGRLWLILTMFAGRVGPITLAVALVKVQSKSMMRYPEGKVLIG